MIGFGPITEERAQSFPINSGGYRAVARRDCSCTASHAYGGPSVCIGLQTHLGSMDPLTFRHVRKQMLSKSEYGQLVPSWNFGAWNSLLDAESTFAWRNVQTTRKETSERKWGGPPWMGSRDSWCTTVVVYVSTLSSLCHRMEPMHDFLL